MSYFKYYVIGYMKDKMYHMQGFDNLCEAEEEIGWARKYCAYNKIELCQITRLGREVIKSYE